MHELAWIGPLAASSRSRIVAASAFGSAGILVAVVFGLFTRVGGAATYLGGVAIGLEYPYLTSLGVALVGYLGIAFAGATR